MSRIATTIALTLLTACSSIFGDDRVEEPADLVTEPDALRYYGGSTITFSSDTIAVGVRDTITVRTGSGGCRHKGRTDAALRDHVLEIRPYTTRSTARDIVCTADFRIDLHVVVRSFSAPGVYTVRAIGASNVTVERPLVVRAAGGA